MLISRTSPILLHTNFISIKDLANQTLFQLHLSSAPMSENKYVQIVQYNVKLSSNCLQGMCIKPLKKADVWEIANQRGLHTRKNLASTCIQFVKILKEGKPFVTFDVRGNEISTAYEIGLTKDFVPATLVGRIKKQGDIPPTYTVNESTSENAWVCTPELVIRSGQKTMHCTRSMDPYPQGFQCALWVRHDVKPLESQPTQCCERRLEHLKKLKDDWEKSAQC
jgi:hypothetical protein